MLAQIALACIILVTYEDLNKFVSKSLSCDTEPAPQPPATPCERPLNPQWASDLAHTVCMYIYVYVCVCVCLTLSLSVYTL
jgi:hypothetical protein